MNTELPSTWLMTDIRSFALDIQPGFARQPNESNEGCRQLRMPSISRSGFIEYTVSKFVDASDDEKIKYGVRRGDVIFNNTNSPELVGNAAVFEDEEECVLSNHMSRIRVDERIVFPPYLAGVLHRYWRTGQTQRRSKQWINQAAIDIGTLSRFRIPLPPLSEQQRIVDILQEVEQIRRLRAQAEAKTAELVPAIFYDRFVRDQAHEYQPLHKLAEVVSGVAIGRKSRGTAIEVPYIRVANVQAGYIDLTEVKTTPANENEIEQYALQDGDVLLTEGGDFDKLGRGALWEGQVSPCIHQNHVFRVRLNREKLLPRFFAHYLQSARAKGYFLRCAKKTTNLASINLTQLMALPVPVVSLEKQEAFEAEIESAAGAVSKAGDRLFTALSYSLSAHAFTGQLTEAWREKNEKKLAAEARDRDAALPQASVVLNGPLHFRVQGDEAIFEPANYAELNREQRDLLREIGELVNHVGKSTTSMMIKATLSGVGYKPYFTAEMLANHLLLPRYDIFGRAQAKVHRNPNAIESDLTVLALRGFIIPLSRARAAHNEDRFAACYRLPITKDDDVRSERLDHQRKLATGEL